MRRDARRWLTVWAAGIVSLSACEDRNAVGPAPLAAPTERVLETGWCGAPEADPALRFLPLSGSFHLLPPVGTASSRTDDLDTTLADALRIVVCRASSDPCTVVLELTGASLDQAEPGGHAEAGLRYHVNVPVDRGLAGQPLELRFYVGDLQLHAHEFVPNSRATLPVKFRVFDNPLVRTEALRRRGLSVTRISELLREEFHLGVAELAWVLQAHGYGVADIYLALTDALGVTDPTEVEGVFDTLCIPESRYLPITTRRLVELFAPVLRFDQAHLGLPMSADVYFHAMMTPTTDDAQGTITWTTPWDGPPLGSYWDPASGMSWEIVSVCGRDECNGGMSNRDFATLVDGKVPTYFAVASDRASSNQGRLRIAYWWFYGFQYSCNDGAGAVSNDGAHHGDWEHVVVTTTPDRADVATVTYFFHGDWYTRQAGGYEAQDGRPVVYVGKTAHGSYHSRDHSGWMVGTPSHCCEYADYRNPAPASVWTNARDNLVSLSIGTESWLRADRPGTTYDHEGRTYTIAAWNWGPHISHCEFDLFGCWDWDHTPACGTHPTTDVLDWSLASCAAEGCDGYTFVCAYSASYDQGWPAP